MSVKRVDMFRLQELVRLHRQGVSCREAARLLKMGPNQERLYRQLLDAAGLLAGPADEVPALDVLKAAVLAERPLPMAPQEMSSAQPWEARIIEMRGRGARPKAIFDTLKADPGFKASLWSVKRLCRRLARAQGPQPEDVAIPVVTLPGAVAQVDFGYVGELFDPDQGLARKAWVFVMVLAHSRHMFCRLVFDQKTETWIRLHIQAFEAFGGVPEFVVPDNLKAAVLRAAFGPEELPELNKSYRELARHYGFKVDPTPPRSPEKKGKVESGVKYVKQNFIKPRVFTDIHDANHQLDQWVAQVAGQRTHGSTGKRPLDVFKTEEQSALRPLPARPYEVVIWKPATVHQDCHIAFERRLYPVPWRFIGKQVWVRAVSRSLEVWVDDERVITHERGVPVPDAITDLCLPDRRSNHRHRSQAFWQKRADALSPQIGEYIQEVFASDDVLSLLRTVISMLTLLEKHPIERADAACRRAAHFGSHTYKALRNILLQGLDLVPLPTSTPPPVPLPSPAYARNPAELLKNLQENTR